MTISRTPTCCSRSQIASTNSTLVEIARPARQLTFKPTTSPGRTTFFHASSGELRPYRFCIARSSIFRSRAESTPEPASRNFGRG